VHKRVVPVEHAESRKLVSGVKTRAKYIASNLEERGVDNICATRGPLERGGSGSGSGVVGRRVNDGAGGPKVADGVNRSARRNGVNWQRVEIRQRQQSLEFAGSVAR
jgi:hypothetical protein